MNKQKQWRHEVGRRHFGGIWRIRDANRRERYNHTHIHTYIYIYLKLCKVKKNLKEYHILIYFDKKLAMIGIKRYCGKWKQDRYIRPVLIIDTPGEWDIIICVETENNYDKVWMKQRSQIQIGSIMEACESLRTFSVLDVQIWVYVWHSYLSLAKNERIFFNNFKTFV